MLLSRSLKQKIAATCGAVLGFVLLREVTMLDSKVTAARELEVRETTARPTPGARLRFSATAYCKGTTTASGTAVRTGIAAADPGLLPVGSVVQIESLSPRYNGIYTIMDTGPEVQGREIDIYMWSCHEALAFGRRGLTLNVLRLGWNPRATSPASIQSTLRTREQQMKQAEAETAASGVPGTVPPAGPAVVPAAATTGTPATEATPLPPRN
jgi:3D (Asp-Asp-Asp) domain-containing protein